MRRVLARGKLLPDGKIAVVPDVSKLCQCDCGQYFTRLAFHEHIQTCLIRKNRRGSA